MAGTQNFCKYVPMYTFSQKIIYEKYGNLLWQVPGCSIINDPHVTCVHSSQQVKILKLFSQGFQGAGFGRLITFNSELNDSF